MENQSSHLKRLIETRDNTPGAFQGYPDHQTPHHSHPVMSYPVFPQSYKASPHVLYPPTVSTYGYNPHQPLARRPSWQYPCDSPRGRVGGGYAPMEVQGNEIDPRTLDDLRDRIVALQMQNVELNLFLKKEELRRKEAEDAVRKEKENVKKLQNSLQVRFFLF